MTTATIKIMDEVSIVVHGLSDQHNTVLYEQFGVHAPNYFFNPRFKLGQWDGKIRYFQKNGRTFLYLIYDIVAQLVKWKYEIDLRDERKSSLPTPTFIDNQIFAQYNHPDTGEPVILRDDQVNAVNSLLKDGSGTCLASTSAGKTFITAALTQAYGKLGLRALTIVPDTGLIRQTKRDYDNFGLDTGEYSGTIKDINHDHVVTTWQALKNNPKIVELFQVVIVDEAHGLKGPVLHKILIEHCANVPYRFGVTGTLPKEASDRLAVMVAVGEVKVTILARDLMKEKVLAQLHIDIVQLEEDLHSQYEEYCNCVTFGAPVTYARYKDEYFSDFSAEKSYLERKSDRIAWIAGLIEAKRNQEKGNVLCLVNNIPFGRKLAASIPNAIFVNGNDVKKVEDRQAIYDLFKTEDHLVVIATVHIAGTGISIRRIFNLVTVDIGKSFIRVIQAIGRGLRISADKSEVNMTDICSDLKYAKKHLSKRIDYYKEAHYNYKKHKIAYKQNNHDWEEE